MWKRLIYILLAAVLSVGVFTRTGSAQSGPPRIALVIGNANYSKAPLRTALNDAGLVAEALRSIGFEIVEGADLSQLDMLRLFREFLAKVQTAGPGATALIYFSGYGLQYDGDDFLVSAEAKLERESDILKDTQRMSDWMRPFAATPARAKVIVVDAARRLPFALKSKPLAAVSALPGMLVAFAAAPGMLAEDRAESYGAYAVALAEMLRTPGLDLDSLFTRVRARTHMLTGARQTPWQTSTLPDPIVLNPQITGDPATPAIRSLRAARPMRDMNPDEAYALAVELDTLDGYVSFVTAFPRHAFTRRVWATVRARREALAWMRAVQFNSADSYWTYLKRYPLGVYVADAGRRLKRISAANDPPSDFSMMEFYDVPPPLAAEPDDYYDVVEGGPQPPSLLIGPPPPFFAALPPPNTARKAGRALPVPVAIPPLRASAPAAEPVAAPAVDAPPAAAPAAVPAVAPVQDNPQSLRMPPGSDVGDSPPPRSERKRPLPRRAMRGPPTEQRDTLAPPLPPLPALPPPPWENVQRPPQRAERPAQGKPVPAKKCRVVIIEGRKYCAN